MKMMKRVSFLGMAVAGALSAFGAAEVYVKAGLASYAGHGGGSWDDAYETIQEGVDGVDAGGTVWVWPGTYNKGEIEDTKSASMISNRVVISKGLTLKSAGSAKDTFIVGRKDPDTLNTAMCGVGPAAVRGILVNTSSKVVIQGFTICGGGTKDGGNAALSQGGGVWMPNSGSTYVVDCIVSNNVATRGGGIWGGAAVRTLFTDNHAAYAGTAMRLSYAYNCIVSERDTGGNICAIDTPKVLVNCTFVKCANTLLSASGAEAEIRNCVFAICETPYKTSQTKEILFSHSVTEYETATTLVRSDSEGFVNGSGPVLFAPAFGDWRVVKGGSADGTGDTGNLDLIPEEFRDKDFNGNPRTTGDKVNMGAVEDSVASAGGVVVFNFNPYIEEVSVDGTKIPVSGLYAHSETWPIQHRMEIEEFDDEVTVWGVYQSGAWSMYRYPDANGSFYFTMPASGSTITNTVKYADRVVWVAPNGDDDYAGDDLGDEDHPYGTLQAAADAARAGSSRGVVYAKRGTYNQGDGAYYGCKNRLVINGTVRVIAKDGPENTFIVGAKDTTSETAVDGCGADSTRCVAAGNGVECSIEGFTLTGGYSCGDGSKGGGAAMGSLMQIIGCVISNNVSLRAAAAWGCWLQRCYITDNTTATGGNAAIRNGYASGCVLSKNNVASYVIGYYGELYNCTVYAPWKQLNSTDVKFYNTIFHTASTLGTLAEGTGVILGSVMYNVTTKSSTTGFITDDPKLVDAANGDFRIRSDSPALGAGSADMNNFARYTTTDIDGNPILFVNGKPTPGAYQRPVAVVNVTSIKSDEIDLSAGAHVVTPGSTLTVNATDEKRKLLGFSFGGEFTADDGSRKFVFTADDSIQLAPTEFHAVYSSNWYVNADGKIGSDSNDGWTAATPKLTLTGAMANVVSGDVVHAASGVYASGDGVQSTPKRDKADLCPDLRSRVVVPQYVTLEGADRDECIVEGQYGTDCGDSYNRGTNALRCVYLEKGATIRNFTIRKGRVAPDKFEDDNNRGGGVRGADYKTCIVDHCLITDCVAFRAGAGFYATFRNCEITGNTGIGNGGAGRQCEFVNCLVSNNKGSQIALVMYNVIGCVFTADNQSSYCGPEASGEGIVANSIFFQPTGSGCTSPKAMTNVVLIGGLEMSATVSEYGTKSYATAEAAGLDANMKPIWGSELIDGGNNDCAVLQGKSELDINGIQRIYNGTVDIGCYEYDYRPRYAASIKADSLTVDEASANVRESDGKVFLDGGEISGTRTFAETGVKHCFSANVTGTGTLSLYFDDDDEAVMTWDATTAEAFAWRDPEMASCNYRFVYTPGENDEGGAYILPAKDGLGMVISIR